MSDLESTDWSEVAANNIQPPPAGWPPGSSPNIVYTTDRETMGAIKRDWNRRNATVTSGGSANAQTLTYTQNPTALVRGQRYAFIAGFANTGAMTLQVGSLAATAVQVNGGALVGGELKVGLISEVIYDGANFQLIAGSGAGSGAYLPLAGGTVSGQLTIAAGATTNLVLNKTATSGQSNAVFGQTNNLNRWLVEIGNATAESSGSGSDFVVSRYNDAGAVIDQPVTIPRGTGIINTSQYVGGKGYCIKAGAGAAIGASGYNFNWTGSLTCWIDVTNVGTVTLTSDYRIKRDIAPLPSMWDRVKALKPISYKHKDYTPPIEGAKQLFSDDGTERWGFVAHELQETLIEDAASGKKDEENVIQSPNLMTVVATLTKALQEAMARIEKLEARLPLAPETA